MASFRYRISFDGVEGVLEFNDGRPVVFSVKHPSLAVVEAVTKHLTQEREFRVPESPRIDDFRVDFLPPTTDENYFRMAVSELAGATDVIVVDRIR